MMLFALLLAAAAAPAAADPAAAAAANPADAPATQSVAPIAAAGRDTEPPSIQDIAFANQDPEAAPVATVVMSDEGSGIGDCAVLYRAPGESAFTSVLLIAGANNVYLARLPLGLQKTGFDYYVEVKDKQGNPANIGTADKPLHADPAVKSTHAMLEEVAVANAEPLPKIHPVFVAIAIGGGLAAAGGAGLFAMDIVTSQQAEADFAERLKGNTLSPKERQLLVEGQNSAADAVGADVIATTVLGVVAVAGLATGVTLAVIASLEE